MQLAAVAPESSLSAAARSTEGRVAGDSWVGATAADRAAATGAAAAESWAGGRRSGVHEWHALRGRGTASSRSDQGRHAHATEASLRCGVLGQHYVR